MLVEHSGICSTSAACCCAVALLPDAAAQLHVQPRPLMGLVTTFAGEVLLKMRPTAVKWRIIEMKGHKDVRVSLLALTAVTRGGVTGGWGGWQGVMTLSPLH